jgi:hypothetical protein
MMLSSVDLIETFGPAVDSDSLAGPVRETPHKNYTNAGADASPGSRFSTKFAAPQDGT